MWFEDDLLPGYAWSFPLPGNRANVGFGVLRNGERRIQTMKQTWPELLARPHIAEALGPDATPEAPAHSRGRSPLESTGPRSATGESSSSATRPAPPIP